MKITNLIIFISVSFFTSACSTKTAIKKDKNGVILAETTSRNAKEGEVIEKVAEVGNLARTEKQTRFLAGQKATDVGQYEKALLLLIPVAQDENRDEMNYLAATLVFDAYSKLKQLPELCMEVGRLKNHLCQTQVNTTEDIVEFCKDLYELDVACISPEK